MPFTDIRSGTDVSIGSASKANGTIRHNSAVSLLRQSATSEHEYYTVLRFPLDKYCFQLITHHLHSTFVVCEGSCRELAIRQLGTYSSVWNKYLLRAVQCGMLATLALLRWIKQDLLITQNECGANFLQGTHAAAHKQPALSSEMVEQKEETLFS